MGFRGANLELALRHIEMFLVPKLNTILFLKFPNNIYIFTLQYFELITISLEIMHT